MTNISPLQHYLLYHYFINIFLSTDCDINLSRQLKLEDIYIIFNLKSFTEKPALIKMAPQTRVRPENDASHII